MVPVLPRSWYCLGDGASYSSPVANVMCELRTVNETVAGLVNANDGDDLLNCELLRAGILCMAFSIALGLGTQ